jgi:O-antigen ligase
MSLLRRPMPHAQRAPFGSGVPVWVLLGQLSIVLFLFITFDTMPVPVNPKPALGLVLMLLGGMVLFAPRGLLRNVYFSATTVLFLAWWVASVSWAPAPGQWLSITIAQLPWVGLLIVVGSTLPKDRIVAALLAAIYTMLVWTFVTTALHPGETTVLLNGATGEVVNVGWRGPFGHKNMLASFMIAAMLVVLTHEKRLGVRRFAVAAMVALVVLSRSGTGAGSLIAVTAVYLLCRHLARASGRKLGVAMVLTGLSGVVTLVGVVTFLPAIVSLYGKDLTFTGRTQIWQASLDAIERKPWTGYGWGGVWIDPTKEPTFTMIRRLGFIVFHAHNGAIELMLELGVIGLALFLAMFVAAVREGFRLLHRDIETAQLLLGFCTLVLVASISEVLVVGPWLGILVLLRTLALRSMREAARAARAASAVERPPTSMAMTTSAPGARDAEPAPATAARGA